MPRGHWKQRGAKSSADSERHFRRRLSERYGLTITAEEYFRLCKDVREQRARALFRESNTRTHWLIDVRGVSVRAVYDKTQGALATALPPLASAMSAGTAETQSGSGLQPASAVAATSGETPNTSENPHD
jgi:AraC-like DNA-binding protein